MQGKERDFTVNVVDKKWKVSTAANRKQPKILQQSRRKFEIYLENLEKGRG